jgi:hypothetical protein
MCHRVGSAVFDQRIQDGDCISGSRDKFWPVLSACYAIAESQEFRDFPLCLARLRPFNAGEICEARLRFEHEGDKSRLEAERRVRWIHEGINPVGVVQCRMVDEHEKSWGLNRDANQLRRRASWEEFTKFNCQGVPDV